MRKYNRVELRNKKETVRNNKRYLSMNGRELARAMGIAASTARKWLNEFGVQLTNPADGPKNQEAKEKLLLDPDFGLAFKRARATHRELGERYGVHAGIVGRMMIRHGIRPMGYIYRPRKEVKREIRTRFSDEIDAINKLLRSWPRDARLMDIIPDLVRKQRAVAKG